MDEEWSASIRSGLARGDSVISELGLDVGTETCAASSSSACVFCQVDFKEARPIQAGKREIKVLHCFHSVCGYCLERLLQNGLEVTCPICDETMSDKSYHSFLCNFAVNEEMDTCSAGEQQHGLVCDECVDAALAVEYCEDCVLRLCKECSTHHKRARTTSFHRMKDVGDQTEHSMHRASYCFIHPDRLVEFFCKTCSQMVCSLCAQTHHENHDYKLPVGHFAEDERGLLRDHVLQLHSLARDVHERHKSITRSIKGCDAELDAAKLSVESMRAQVNATIQQRRQELHEEVGSLKEQRRLVLEELREATTSKMVSIWQTINFVEQILASGTSMEIMFLKSYLKAEHINDADLSAAKLTLQSIGALTLRWRDDKTKEASASLRNMGEVVVRKNFDQRSPAEPPRDTDARMRVNSASSTSPLVQPASGSPKTAAKAKAPMTLKLEGHVVSPKLKVKNPPVVKASVDASVARPIPISIANCSKKPISLADCLFEDKIAEKQISLAECLFEEKPADKPVEKPISLAECLFDGDSTTKQIALPESLSDDTGTSSSNTSTSSEEIPVRRELSPAKLDVKPVIFNMIPQSPIFPPGGMLSKPRSGLHDTTDEELRRWGIGKLRAVIGSEGTGFECFLSPCGLDVDSRYVYIADTLNHRIQIFDRYSHKHLGRVNPMKLMDTGLRDPSGLCIIDERHLAIVEYGQDRLVHVRLSEEPPFRITHSSAVDESLYGPFGCGYVDGRLYVADSCHHRVVAVDLSGKTVLEFGTRGIGPGQFEFPACIAVFSDGSVAVSDKENHRIQVFDPEGQFTNYIPKDWVHRSGHVAAPKGQLLGPMGVCSDRQDRVYVCDCGSNRIQVFTRNGEWLWSSDTCKRGFNFQSPTAIAIDNDGQLYIASDHCVQVFERRVS